MTEPADQRAADVPAWIRRAGGIAWRFLAVALAIYVVAHMVVTLTLIVVPVALAVLLTGILDPVVRRLERPRLPDWVVPLAAVLVVLVAVVGAVVGLGVRIADQVPELRDEFASSLEDIEERFSVQLPSLPGSGDGQGSSSGGGSESGLPSGLTEIVTVGADVLFGFFLTLALTFLFLKDGRDLWRWGLAKIDDDHVRDEVDATGRAAWGTVGAYVRGLTVVALFDAAGVGLGLLVLGVPLVATLAALQFIASYVPTIGAFVAGAVAVVVALGSQGVVTAAITLALIVVVQQIGNDVIEPWIMGRVVPLHPAVVLVAVGAGAILWGIAGALLFVPLAAALSAAGHELWERHHPGAVSDR